MEGWEGVEYSVLHLKFGGIDLTMHHSPKKSTLRELRIMNRTEIDFLWRESIIVKGAKELSG